MPRDPSMGRCLLEPTSRQGKIVFYDYDEIEYLTDCNFRRVPPPQEDDERKSDEIWFEVDPKDVFPETFGPFLLGNARVRQAFMKHHADLLDAAYWNLHKQRILAGDMHDVFPYDAQRRFVNRRGVDVPGAAATAAEAAAVTGR